MPTLAPALTQRLTIAAPAFASASAHAHAPVSELAAAPVRASAPAFNAASASPSSHTEKPAAICDRPACSRTAAPRILLLHRARSAGACVKLVRAKSHRKPGCYLCSSRRFAASYARNLAAKGARPAVRGKLHRRFCCYRRSSRRFAANYARNLAATGARSASVKLVLVWSAQPSYGGVQPMPIDSRYEKMPIFPN